MVAPAIAALPYIGAGVGAVLGGASGFFSGSKSASPMDNYWQAREAGRAHRVNLGLYYDRLREYEKRSGVSRLALLGNQPFQAPTFRAGPKEQTTGEALKGMGQAISRLSELPSERLFQKNELRRQELENKGLELRNAALEAQLNENTQAPKPVIGAPQLEDIPSPPPSKPIFKEPMYGNVAAEVIPESAWAQSADGGVRLVLHREMTESLEQDLVNKMGYNVDVARAIVRGWIDSPDAVAPYWKPTKAPGEWRMGPTGKWYWWITRRPGMGVKKRKPVINRMIEKRRKQIERGDPYSFNPGS